MSFSGAMLLIISSLAAQNLTSQQFDKPKKKNEFGLNFNERTGLSIMYDREIKANKYFRIDGNLKSAPFGYSNLAIGIGIENRILITSKLSFYHGMNVNYFRSRILPYDTRWNTTGVSLGYRLGVRYDINKHFFVGAEINPQIGVLQGPFVTQIGNSQYITSDNNPRDFKTLGVGTVTFGVKF